MPEGVEVKLSSEIVSSTMRGRLIVWAEPHPNSRYSGSPPEGYKEFIDSIKDFSNPCIVTGVQAKGKFMYWTFSNDWNMFCTYGMTGQWSPIQGKHPCLSIRHGQDQIADNQYIYFNDQRHFGTIKFVRGPAALKKKLDELGWDPLQMPLDKNMAWLKQQLSRTGKPIGEVLMDQGIFAGVGNYIRAEALYLSEMSPFRAANKLSEGQIRNLCQSIIDVMEESYKHQGATIQTYKTVYGEEGKYSSLFKIYGKKKDPAGNVIVREDLAGRTVHWCPTIQV